jgi:hypothetical protein
MGGKLPTGGYLRERWFMSKYEELASVAKEALEEVTQKSAKSAAKKPKAVVDVRALKRQVRDIDEYWYGNDMPSPRSLYSKSKPETQNAWNRVSRWQSPDAPMDLDEFVSMWNADSRERAKLIKQIKKATGEDWDTGY